MKHRFKPRLMPLVRRHGWLLGWCRWRHCRSQAHDWWIVPNSQYCHACGWGSDGVWFSHNTVKVRCSCCESAAIIRLEVYRFPNGVLRVVATD